MREIQCVVCFPCLLVVAGLAVGQSKVWVSSSKYQCVVSLLFTMCILHSIISALL